MIAVVCNALAVLLGGVIGILFKKIIPDSFSDIIQKGMGLVSLYIGITGMMVGQYTLVMIICLVIGALLGEGFQLEQRFDAFSHRIEEKLDARGGKSNFAQGFVTTSFMMCVGAMTVVGSLNAGLNHDYTLLFTKTAMDGVSSIMFTASMGIGAICAAGPILIIQGGLVLLAGFLQPFLTDVVIGEMTCVGSLLIIALGLNLTGAAKLKVLNYMPAVFLPIVVLPAYNYVLSLL